MPQTAQEILETLRPLRKPNLMDLLDHAGVDVSDWHFKGADRSERAKVPASNPAFCYEWAHGSADTVLALCIWHESIHPSGERLVFKNNTRRAAQRLEAEGRARVAERARDFDNMVRLAYDRKLALRMVIGTPEVKAPNSSAPPQVKCRMLDSVSWYVHAYNPMSGDVLIVRGIEAGQPSHAEAGESSSPLDADEESERQWMADEREFASIRARRGQREFRARLRQAWKERCVVTDCEIVGLLEAAHIVPHAQEADYRTSNGLLLRSDIHTLFDLGLLSLDETMSVHLAPKIRDSPDYRALEGKPILRRPERASDAPSPQALARRHRACLERWNANES